MLDDRGVSIHYVCYSVDAAVQNTRRSSFKLSVLFVNHTRMYISESMEGDRETGDRMLPHLQPSGNGVRVFKRIPDIEQAMSYQVKNKLSTPWADVRSPGAAALKCLTEPSALPYETKYGRPSSVHSGSVDNYHGDLLGLSEATERLHMIRTWLKSAS